MARIGAGFDTKAIFMVIIIAVVGLYLFSQFFVKKTGWEFQLPVDTSKTALMVFKMVVLGVVTYASLVLAGKLGAPLGKRDAFTLILLGIGIWFLWDKILAPMLGATTIEEWGTRLAQSVLGP